MNRNKSFVELHNKPLIEIIIDKLKLIFHNNIIVITNEPALYRYLDVDLKSDLIKGKGPIGGIYTGLTYSESFYNFFLPCDMPFINADAIKYLMAAKDGYDVTVPVIGGYIEPLCGIYSKNCLQPIEKCLFENKLKVKSFYQQVQVNTIPEEIFRNIDPALKMFTNINTPKHLELAQQM